MKALCYKKLWHLLLERDLQKKDLYEMAGVGNSTVTKLGNDENVSTATLEKICNALGVDISEICEMVEKKQ